MNVITCFFSKQKWIKMKKKRKRWYQLRSFSLIFTKFNKNLNHNKGRAWVYHVGKKWITKIDKLLT
jgi:hypothetical protein